MGWTRAQVSRSKRLLNRLRGVKRVLLPAEIIQLSNAIDLSLSSEGGDG